MNSDSLSRRAYWLAGFGTTSIGYAIFAKHTHFGKGRLLVAGIAALVSSLFIMLITRKRV